MNAYNFSRKFWDYAFDNPHKIKPYHCAIYFFAIEHCNRLGWKIVFGFPTSMVLESTGIKSYSSYKRYFDDLVEWDFFKVHEYSKNQYSSNIIELTLNDKATNKALDKALVKHDTKQRESTVQSIDSINKQITSNNITTSTSKQVSSDIDFDTKINNISDEIKTAYKQLFHLFDKKDRPSDKKGHLKWLETLDKLNRLDDYPVSEIVNSIKWAKKDEFWSKQILSLVSIRSKSKNGSSKFRNMYVKYKDTKPKKVIRHQDNPYGDQFKFVKK